MTKEQSQKLLKISSSLLAYSWELSDYQDDHPKSMSAKHLHEIADHNDNLRRLSQRVMQLMEDMEVIRVEGMEKVNDVR